MNMLRKLSSRMRRSRDLSTSLERSTSVDTPTLTVDQGAEASNDRQDDSEEVKDLLLHNLEPDDDDMHFAAQTEEAPMGASPIRVRALICDEQGDDDDENINDDGPTEEEEEEDVDDGKASHGSGESFNSALERMAASSEASYDTALSPKITSPVGSLQSPEGVKNPLASGDLSEKSDVISYLDQQIAKLENQAEGDNSYGLKASRGISGKQSKRPQSPMPKARVTSDEVIGTWDFGKAPNKGSSNWVPHSNSVIEEHKEVSDDNDREQEEPIPCQAMPMAKLSTEDEDGIVELEDDKLSIEGQHEEDMIEEPLEDVREKDGNLNHGRPLNIRAVLSDLDNDVVLPLSAYESPTRQSDEHNDEDFRPAKVHGSLEESKSMLTRPIAKPSDDDAPLLVDQPDVQSAIFSTPKLQSGEVLMDESVSLVALEEVSNIFTDHESAKIPFEEKDGAEVEAGDVKRGNREDEDDNFFDRSTTSVALCRGADSTTCVEVADASAPSLGLAGPSLLAQPMCRVKSTLPSLDPSPRVVQQPCRTEATPVQSSSSMAEESEANCEPPDGNEETRRQLQLIRVKFLRLALRLGQSAQNVVIAQVLYRLGLAEQLKGGRSGSQNKAFNFDRANSVAQEQERAGPEELDFDCTIMILGKTGVGKSATINSIFDETKTRTNAFSPATNKVQVITGHVHGIKVRVIDTPGLLPSVFDQRHNEKIMASVKIYLKKQSPDIVLYFDRLDMQSRDYSDLPLLQTMTDTLGATMWFNAIVVLTHASSAPPDGPNGHPLSYEMFVSQRSHVVQQTIRKVAGDMRLMNPVSLVENHIACRVNRARDKVLPNGQVWRPQLLLLCFASKILAEANSLLKLQDNTPGRPVSQRSRVPPLPFLLSCLLQSRASLKLQDEQVGDEDESDEDLEEDDDSEEEEDYDQLPLFRRLSKEEVAELDDVNRGQYFEELAERERLFQKKEWKEELKRRRELKKRMANAPMDESRFGEEKLEEDMTRSAAVPIPIPDMVLPPSFDSDNPSHRYRYLETANEWLVRPVLETHGWDHDNGYDGMSVEKKFVIRDKVPTSISGQITKDKKEANLNMECSASIKHGEGTVTLAGLDLQTVGKDLAYTLRSETRFSNCKGNKTSGGLSMTLLGDTVSTGMKIENRLRLGKRAKLVVNGGAIIGGGDVAYGGSLEATLRDKEYPLSQTLSTLGVSIMDWHGDLAVGGNLQSQFVLGKTTMVGRANLNNRGAGQISIRASSSEQLQMALIGIIPIVRAVVNHLFAQAQQYG